MDYNFETLPFTKMFGEINNVNCGGLPLESKNVIKPANDDIFGTLMNFFLVIAVGVVIYQIRKEYIKTQTIDSELK